MGMAVPGGQATLHPIFTPLKWVQQSLDPARLSGEAWNAMCCQLGSAWGGMTVPGFSRNQQDLSSSVLHGLTKAGTLRFGDPCPPVPGHFSHQLCLWDELTFCGLGPSGLESYGCSSPPLLATLSPNVPSMLSGL